MTTITHNYQWNLSKLPNEEADKSQQKLIHDGAKRKNPKPTTLHHLPKVVIDVGLLSRCISKIRNILTLRRCIRGGNTNNRILKNINTLYGCISFV